MSDGTVTPPFAGYDTEVFRKNLVAIRFNLDPLESTTILSHLRRMVTFNDINWAALYSNLKKAHG